MQSLVEEMVQADLQKARADVESQHSAQISSKLYIKNMLGTDCDAHKPHKILTDLHMFHQQQ